MTVPEAVLLGLVQGLTEFLPVSSSGHLVLAEALLGVDLPGVVFEVSVHVATLCAVLWVYRRRIAELALGIAGRDRESLRYVGLLALASIPAGLAGVLGRSAIESLFDRPIAAAIFLLVTGALVWTLRRTTRRRGSDRVRVLPALWVGVAQATAILPGISRSGATVAAGVWRGIDAVRAAEFSFLLSVPAIAGAAVLQSDAMAATAAHTGVAPLLVGFAAALVSGVLAIRIFVRFLESRRFHHFAWYCWGVGSAYLFAAALLPGLRG